MEYKFSISVPIYETKKNRKTKKETTRMIGLNYYRNLHYRSKNTLKQKYGDMMIEKARTAIIKERPRKSVVEGKYFLVTHYYYKSSISDVDNVGPLMTKFYNDALQKGGIVKNDNVNYCVASLHFVAEQDKVNPRIVIELFEVGDEEEVYKELFDYEMESK